MTHTPAPQFLIFEEGIINIHDISTVAPYTTSGLRWNVGQEYAGVRVTMRSKSTHIDLPGQTLAGFETRLNGAVF